MATPVLSPSRLLRHAPFRRPPPNLHRRRPFLTSLLPRSPLPLPPPQTLTASRTLPFPSEPLFAIIADVDAYASFLPYCQSSRVTAWTAPAPTSHRGHGSGGEPEEGQRWPTRAELCVGWGPVTVAYTSELRCSPFRTVEALSGRAAGRDSGPAQQAGDGIFESLVTKWELDSLTGGGGATGGHGGGSVNTASGTTVHLSIRYQFTNPMYQLSAGKFSQEIAGLMIEAFESRARQLLSSPAGSAWTG